MKAILINKNPAISRLISLSLQKLNIVYKEIDSVEGLEECDIIIADSECDIDIDKCKEISKKLILLLPKNETSDEALVIHKPFLPTDFIDLINSFKDELKEETLNIHDELENIDLLNDTIDLEDFKVDDINDELDISFLDENKLENDLDFEFNDLDTLEEIEEQLENNTEEEQIDLDDLENDSLEDILDDDNGKEPEDDSFELNEENLDKPLDDNLDFLEEDLNSNELEENILENDLGISNDEELALDNEFDNLEENELSNEELSNELDDLHNLDDFSMPESFEELRRDYEDLLQDDDKLEETILSDDLETNLDLNEELLDVDNNLDLSEDLEIKDDLINNDFNLDEDLSLDDLDVNQDMKLSNLEDEFNLDEEVLNEDLANREFGLAEDFDNLSEELDFNEDLANIDEENANNEGFENLNDFDSELKEFEDDNNIEEEIIANDLDIQESDLISDEIKLEDLKEKNEIGEERVSDFDELDEIEIKKALGEEISSDEPIISKEEIKQNEIKNNIEVSSDDDIREVSENVTKAVNQAIINSTKSTKNRIKDINISINISFKD